MRGFVLLIVILLVFVLAVHFFIDINVRYLFVVFFDVVRVILARLIELLWKLRNSPCLLLLLRVLNGVGVVTFTLLDCCSYCHVPEACSRVSAVLPEESLDARVRLYDAVWVHQILVLDLLVLSILIVAAINEALALVGNRRLPLAWCLLRRVVLTALVQHELGLVNLVTWERRFIWCLVVLVHRPRIVSVGHL